MIFFIIELLHKKYKNMNTVYEHVKFSNGFVRQNNNVIGWYLELDLLYLLKHFFSLQWRHCSHSVFLGSLALPFRMNPGLYFNLLFCQAEQHVASSSQVSPAPSLPAISPLLLINLVCLLSVLYGRCPAQPLPLHRQQGLIAGEQQRAGCITRTYYDDEMSYKDPNTLLKKSLPVIRGVLPSPLELRGKLRGGGGGGGEPNLIGSVDQSGGARNEIKQPSSCCHA